MGSIDTADAVQHGYTVFRLHEALDFRIKAEPRALRER